MKNPTKQMNLQMRQGEECVEREQLSCRRLGRDIFVLGFKEIG